MPPNTTLARADTRVRRPVRRLPITTPPFPSETVGSYVRRLAIVNHLHPSEFEDYLRRRERRVNPARLAAVSGRPLSVLRHALPELRSASDLPADFDHHEPTLACRHCTARRGITGPVTCWAPPHRNVCLRHRRWVGHIDPAFQGLLDGRDPQPDLTLLPDVVSAERRLRRLIRRHGQSRVILAYRTGLHVAVRWADRKEWGSHRRRRIELLGFVPAADWRFPSWDPVLRAAVYPEAVAVTSLVVSPYWARVAADPRERQRFYAEAARRLRLPDYHPDSVYDPLAQWASHHADFPNGNVTARLGAPEPQAPLPTSDGDSEWAAGVAGRRSVRCRSRRPAASPWSGKVTMATSTLARALDSRPDPEAAADRSGTHPSQGRGGSRATAASTRRFYGSDLADFESYCLEQQLPVRLPVPPAAIAAYLLACAQLRPAPSWATLKRRLYAIRKVHELNGYAGFDNPSRHHDLWPLRRSLRRQLAWPKQQVHPATAADIRRMVQACLPQLFMGLRDRAMLLLGYVLLTASELVALDVEDLVLVDQGLAVVVPRRRPDLGGTRFRVVAVPYLQQRETCPVRAWLAWQEATGLHTGPAFRPVHPRARLDSPDVRALCAAIQAAPRLQAARITLLLKRAAERAGLADWQRYAAYSQRRGAAIQLRRQGASDLEIALAGGWRNLDQVRRLATATRIPDIWDDPDAGRLGL
jgi:hypothetical protein